MWLSDANKQEGFKKENMVRGQTILRDEVKKEALSIGCANMASTELSA